MRNGKIDKIARGLGAAIRKERVSRGFTAKDMAEKAWVSLKTYGNLERGETGVALSTFLSALLLLDIDLSEVIDRDVAGTTKVASRVRRLPKIDDSEVDF